MYDFDNNNYERGTYSKVLGIYISHASKGDNLKTDYMIKCSKYLTKYSPQYTQCSDCHMYLVKSLAFDALVSGFKFSVPALNKYLVPCFEITDKDGDVHTSAKMNKYQLYMIALALSQGPIPIKEEVEESK